MALPRHVSRTFCPKCDGVTNHVSHRQDKARGKCQPCQRRKRAAKPKRKKKRPSATALKRKADRLFSEYIRARDGRCLACGSTENGQCAHIVSRRYHSIRWDPTNAVRLCSADHVRFTHGPVEWRRWVDETFGPERLLDLEGRALVVIKRTADDYEELIADLEARLSELERWAR